MFLSRTNNVKIFIRNITQISLNKIAIVGDIEQAFSQIGLLEDAKDMTRFFYLKNKSRLTVENNIQVYRLNRIPFGITSSPFLLAASLDNHLKDFENRQRKYIYMDNVVTEKEIVKEAVDFDIEAKKIFRRPQ